MSRSSKRLATSKLHNIHEAKTHLSKLVDLASQGQEIIICKAGRPVARLSRYEEPTLSRQPGIWAGKVKIASDFDELPEDFLKHFK